jgi:hypothetical protein
VGLVAAMFACEVGASLLFVLVRQPLLGFAAAGAGMGIALRWVRRHRRLADAALGSQIAAANEALAVRSYTDAWNIACAAAKAASDRRRRNAALTVMAEVAIDENNLRAARELLGRMGPAPDVDPLLEAAIATADGRPDDAIAALERARPRPTFSGAAARRLVELLAERDDLPRAVEIALDCIDLLAVQDLRNMQASLEDWGAPGHAAAIGVALALRAPMAPQKLSLPPAPDPLRD